MFLKSVLLVFLGFMSGTAVSAGTFAFLLVIGVVPRMLRTTNLMDKIITVETVITLGTICGCIMSLWDRDSYIPGVTGKFSLGAGMEMLLSWLEGAGHFLLGVYGISAGIFVGCIAVALAEILDTFPIMFRRFKLTKGLEWLMFAMAFGKLCGSLFSFLGGYNF